MNYKVLMIGPGKETVGGIASLVEILLSNLPAKVNLMYFPTVNKRQLKESGHFSLDNIKGALSQYLRFLKTLHDFDPDIVHLHTSQGLGWLKDTFYIFSSRLKHCRVVVHVNSASFDELYGKRNPIEKLYTRRVMSLADAILAVSTNWCNLLSRIVETKRIHVYRNCIDTKRILPPTKRSFDDMKLLFIGSVGPRKGAFDLIEALGVLKQKHISLHTWIGGYEERTGDLEKAVHRVKELNLDGHCEILGTIKWDEKIYYLQNASLFVLPSYDEGLPLAILEALAAGLPVISTPVGGIPEVVREGCNGFLIQPGDYQSLAEKIEILTKDPELRVSLGKCSRDIAEQELDVKPYVDSLMELYESLN